MTLIAYEPKSFRGDSLALIQDANEIIADYRGQGLDLTLRQLYYQFVARDKIANSDKNYKRLGSILSDARMAGLVSWTSIVDRTRSIHSDLAGYETTHEDLIRDAAEGYFEDLWRDQPYRVEVWVEKEALAGVIQRAAGTFRAPYFSCRGYASQTAMWDASQRIVRYKHEFDQDTLILHLGDHDPSGIDMTRDIEDRLTLFTSHHMRSGHLEVRRIALNMDQIEEYQPPPNPAKLSDSRAAGYVEEHGYESWELDALEPTVLIDLIRAEVNTVLDDSAWQDAVRHENDERAKVVAIADRWTEIVDYLEENPA